MIGGYSLSALGKLLFFLAYSWHFIFLARVVDRIGKGVRTSPRDAMIADSCNAEYRGKAFGFHRAMDTIGACLGPLLAFRLLYACKDDLRSVFLIALVPAAPVGVSKAFVTDVVDKEVRGTAIGLYYCITGFAAFLASLIAGLLWTHIGSSAPFLYGAAALISSLAFLLFL